MDIIIVPGLRNHFPDLKVLAFSVKDVKVEKRKDELEESKKLVFDEVKKRYSLEKSRMFQFSEPSVIFSGR